VLIGAPGALELDARVAVGKMTQRWRQCSFGGGVDTLGDGAARARAVLEERGLTEELLAYVESLSSKRKPKKTSRPSASWPPVSRPGQLPTIQASGSPRVPAGLKVEAQL
jgi:hypothetical protein